MKPNRLLLVSTCTLIAADWGVCSAAQPATHTAGTVIVAAASSHPTVILAAREIRRYTYLRTGLLLPVVASPAPRADLIVLTVNPALGRESHALKTTPDGTRKVLTISGGGERAVLYGAYRFAETLGVRFQLHGDSVPDAQIPFALPELDETHAPLFDTRGVQPFHDFTEGPDWWTLDDYKAHFAQMAKLRMNLLGLHCYPEGGVGPEPLIWIGLPEDVNDDGTVNFSYPSRWASTSGGSWGYAPTKTSEFAAGASLLFPGDDYGSPVTDGFRPLPQTPAAENAVFNRAGRLLREAFAFGKWLGVRTCLGTETPLHIPKAVVARLKEKGLDPKAPATARLLYTGMFKRIKATHSLDFYWLWTPEDWTWGGNKPGQLEATLADLDAALGALDDLGQPFTLATCGWVLGPQQDRAALDQHLPKSSPLSCINRQVGFSFVEPAFARIEGRPQWAIPWVEDDPNMIGAQLWAGRTRRDAADAHAYGCTGFLGIHWRTRVLAPTFAALAQAGWNQQPWNPDFGQRQRVEARDHDVRLGGHTAAYLNDRPRDLPCDDLYADWTRAEFGPAVAGPLARLFTRLDGGQGDYSNDKNRTHLPRPSDWLAGPGGIKPNPTPWEQERARYAFVDDLAALRPQVQGAGHLARFDYWLNTFRFHRALGQLGCTRGELDAVIKRLAKETSGDRRQELALAQALPVRLALARQWETMMTHLLQTVSTPGELGTIANLEQHSRRNPGHPHFLELHDARLAEWTGAPLPAAAEPSRAYRGPARIIVPTVRSVLQQGERHTLRLMILAATPPREATLHWRPLGGGPYEQASVTPVARAVYQATLPATDAEALEYFLRVQMPEGERLHWPATAPAQGQTVVRMPVAYSRQFP